MKLYCASDLTGKLILLVVKSTRKWHLVAIGESLGDNRGNWNCVDAFTGEKITRKYFGY